MSKSHDGDEFDDSWADTQKEAEWEKMLAASVDDAPMMASTKRSASPVGSATQSDDLGAYLVEKAKSENKHRRKATTGQNSATTPLWKGNWKLQKRHGQQQQQGSAFGRADVPRPVDVVSPGEGGENSMRVRIGSGCQERVPERLQETDGRLPRYLDEDAERSEAQMRAVIHPSDRGL